ncbi:MAG: phosphoesterase family protein, partial [Bryobacterales bacterium]|nr:phosphoesterase family protein [Bryobacterales bacterium]
MTRKSLILAASVPVIGILAAASTALFPILKSNARIGKQDTGFFLLPTNQLLQPWGEQAMIKGRPVDAALDSRKQILAVLNTRGIELFDASTSAPLGRIAAKSTSYTGVAFRPGDREIWAGETGRSGGDDLLITPISETGQAGESQRVALSEHPVPAGIAFAADGKTAYVAMSRSNSVAVIDAETKT